MMRFAAAVFLLISCTAVAAAPTVQLTPMHSHGADAKYPRLVAFPDQAIQRKVNALLTSKDAADASQRSDCLSSLKEAHIKPTADSYSLDIRVSYMSSRFASLDVRETYYCGGPYPNDGVPDPLTIDLRSGSEVDWKKIFKPGVLPDESGSGTAKLVSMYQTRYARQPKLIDGCKDAVDGGIDSVLLRLDAAKGGLVVTPDFPHAAQACAVEIAFSPSDIAPFIADKAFPADLQQNAHKGGK
ncbi:MAG TPA: hypothetical protein VGM17_00270 [Rhizomicrobium sp.]|jgi:hypothetical protein